MEKTHESNYYFNQLESIKESHLKNSNNSNFKITTFEGVGTKNISLNDQSAQVLKDFLMNNFNLK